MDGERQKVEGSMQLGVGTSDTIAGMFPSVHRWTLWFESGARGERLAVTVHALRNATRQTLPADEEN